jgi:hypothetical protein
MPKNCIFAPDLETYKKLEPGLRDRLGSWRSIYTDERFPRAVCIVSDATIVKLASAKIPIDSWPGATIGSAEERARRRRTWSLSIAEHLIEMAAINSEIDIGPKPPEMASGIGGITSDLNVWGFILDPPRRVRFVMESHPDIQGWTKVPFDFSIGTYAKEIMQWSLSLRGRTYWTFDHCRFELPIDVLSSDQIEPQLLWTKMERSGPVEEFLVA